MKRWLNSARHALRGILLFIRSERNARIEIFIAVVVILFAVWLDISSLEFSLVILCIGAVLAAEAFNSAVERMADFQTKEQHPEIRNIKDIAAGAVLIAAMVSAVIGVLIFGPALLDRIS
jgi:undecaprenol kinase